MEVEKKDPAVRIKFLHEELMAGRLTHHEYQKECAYWILENEPWKDLMPVDIPAKPADYEAWGRMSDDDRAVCDSDYYKSHPSIMWYIKKVVFAWHTNLSRIENIIFLKQFLLADDKPAHEKFYYKIKEYLTMLYKINTMRQMCEGDFDLFKQEIMAKIEG